MDNLGMGRHGLSAGPKQALEYKNLIANPSLHPLRAAASLRARAATSPRPSAADEREEWKGAPPLPSAVAPTLLSKSPSPPSLLEISTLQIHGGEAADEVRAPA